MMFHHYDFRDIWKYSDVYKAFQRHNIILSANENQGMKEILKSYNDIPFHNEFHARAVTSLLSKLLLLFDLPQDKIKQMLFIALAHDIQHDGQTNKSIHSSFDGNYSPFHLDRVPSYNEHKHLSVFETIMYNHNISLEPHLAKKCILSTDITNTLILSTLKNETDQLLVKLLKLADIGHILLDFETHKKWVFAFHKEMLIGLNKKEIAKDTIEFNEIYVKPLLLDLKKDTLLKKYEKHINKWKIWSVA